MELQFQKPLSHAQQQWCQYQVPVAKETNKPSRARSKCRGGGKFVGVRQRPSGRWVAEIKDTTQKIRMWLGTFETAEEAARAYDEAACLLRGANTRTNFAAGAAPLSPPDSPLSSRIRALLNHKKFKRNTTSLHPTIVTAYRHGGTGSINSTSTSASTVTTSGVSPSSSTSSATINFAMSNGGGVRIPILPAHSVTEEAYRPYLIGGSEEFQLASQQYEQPWALLPTEGRDKASDFACSAMAELEKISPEKESPASPHAHVMDRVQDLGFLETGNDPSDALWDLPPICPLSCRSFMY